MGWDVPKGTVKFDVPVVLGSSKPGAASGPAAVVGGSNVSTKLLVTVGLKTSIRASRSANFKSSSTTTSEAKFLRTMKGPPLSSSLPSTSKSHIPIPTQNNYELTLVS